MNTLSMHDLKAVIDILKEKLILFEGDGPRYRVIYMQLQTAEDLMDQKLQAIGIIL